MTRARPPLPPRGSFLGACCLLALTVGCSETAEPPGALSWFDVELRGSLGALADGGPRADDADHALRRGLGHGVAVLAGGAGYATLSEGALWVSAGEIHKHWASAPGEAIDVAVLAGAPTPTWMPLARHEPLSEAGLAGRIGSWLAYVKLPAGAAVPFRVDGPTTGCVLAGAPLGEASLRLVGVYSPGFEGEITEAGRTLSLHAIQSDPPRTGPVTGCQIPVEAEIRVPAVEG